MVMNASTSNAGVRLRVLGIPVRFDTWFFVIGVLLSIQGGFAVVVLWLTILGGSILVHELGHALVARTTGAEPHIVIHALGGYTSWLPPDDVSRGKRVSISLAGPAAGIALGAMFVIAEHAGVGADGGLAGRAIFLGIRVNILYGLFNLLPILPLDGGQTLRDLLPGSAEGRERTAAIVSIVVGAAAVAGALAVHEPFAALFVAFFVAGNVTSLRAGRVTTSPRRPAAPSAGGALAEAAALHAAGNFDAAAASARHAAALADRAGDHRGAVAALQMAAVARLDAGAPEEAKQLLLDLPPGSVDPLVEGRVLFATGQAALGAQRIAAAFAARADERTAYHLGFALSRTGDVEGLVRACNEPRVSAAALIAAARGSLDAGAPIVAGRLAEIAGGRAAGPEFAFAAYVAALAWTAAGDSERALLALRAAVQGDPRYAATAANDEGLRALRGFEFDQIVRG